MQPGRENGVPVRDGDTRRQSGRSWTGRHELHLPDNRRGLNPRKAAKMMTIDIH